MTKLFTLVFLIFSFGAIGQIGYDQSATTLENATYTGANHLSSDPTSGGQPGKFPGDSYSGTVTDDGVSADFTVTHLAEQKGYQPSTENKVFSSPGYGIGINAQSDYTPPSVGTGNDVMAYKITLTNVPTTHKPVIRLMQDYFGQNSEYSTYKVSWVGGETANAVYKDAPANSAVDAAGLPPTTTNGYYKFGSHVEDPSIPNSSNFDLNNRQIEGLDHEGEITNGGTFNVYALPNNKAEWHVEFPVGVTEVSVIKTVSTGGVDATQNPQEEPASYYSDPANGIGKLYPAYGNEAGYARANGESTREFFAFKVDFVPNSILPVEFGEINAHSTKDGVHVSWSTLSEINNSHFEVERSHDGINFYNIGKILGKGNSSSKLEYKFIDSESDGYGKLYYRIKQVDFDGRSAFSEIVYVKLGFSESISIYPNPASSGKLHLKGVKVRTVDVYDLKGRIVYSGGSKSMDLSQLQKGVYIVVVNKHFKERIVLF